MIKATDLRIGNYVKDKKYPITYKVTAIGENGGWMQVTDEFEDIDSAIEKLEPIPLTEEWLLRMGFRNGTLKKYKKEVGMWRKNKCSLYWQKGKGFRLSGKGIKVKSVSQLQNLYYFLTGKELVLK
jgi:hypothetical protein